MELSLGKLFLITLFYSECRSEDSVDQPGGFLTASEGDSVTLPCTYTSTSTGQDYLFWYQQKPHGIPAYILWRYSTSGSNDETFKERFEANLTSNSVPLTIQNLQVSDSAVYYCALRPNSGSGNGKIIFGSGTKLLIESKTKAKPKYYKLARDNTTACLGIDLNSINGSTDEPDFLKESEATRIVGDSYYSKAAIMSTYDQCPTLDGKKCEPGAGGGVEPDEKLNFLSLSVLGLRILFLKTIAFNILMTVRYWMR